MVFYMELRHLSGGWVHSLFIWDLRCQLSPALLDFPCQQGRVEVEAFPSFFVVEAMRGPGAWGAAT